MSPSPTTRTAFAEYLEDQARWREDVDERFPDDPRNLQWAARLKSFAEQARALPDGYDDLQLIDKIWGRYGSDVFDVPMVVQQTHMKPHTDDFLKWLHGFAISYLDETLIDMDGTDQSADLTELAQDPNPVVSLSAVRQLTYALDEWEAGSVERARAQGITWKRIGQLLGKASQTVWKKYHTSGDDSTEED